MSATGDIIQSYRRPRAVIRRHLDRGVDEGRIFVFLLCACLLVFIAQWPKLSREAHQDGLVPIDERLAELVPLDARLGAALLGWLFIAPLFFYALSGVSFLIARAVGGQGTSYGARLALFWSLLVVAPIWLLQGLVAGFIGAGVQLTLVGLVLLAAFFWVWINSLIETQSRG